MLDLESSASGEECREPITLKNTNTNKDGHNVTSTTTATLQGKKGDSSDSNLLLGTGCSDSILSDNYLNLCDSIKKVKHMYSMASGLHKADKHSAVTFNCQNFPASKILAGVWTLKIYYVA